MKTNFKSIEDAFIYYAEVNLATLEELVGLKSSSIVRISRQKSICAGMLYQCCYISQSLVDRNYPRVKRMVERVAERMGEDTHDAAAAVMKAIEDFETELRSVRGQN